mmetsp:Transcript_72624/g.194091  ORF Transcript_72624/g.194091 Transcript_72624/m.194091 type:complete len:201 (+) Transcript_72624:180-782(+)
MFPKQRLALLARPPPRVAQDLVICKELEGRSVSVGLDVLWPAGVEVLDVAVPPEGFTNSGPLPVSNPICLIIRYTVSGEPEGWKVLFSHVNGVLPIHLHKRVSPRDHDGRRHPGQGAAVDVSPAGGVKAGVVDHGHHERRRELDVELDLGDDWLELVEDRFYDGAVPAVDVDLEHVHLCYLLAARACIAYCLHDVVRRHA